RSLSLHGALPIFERLDRARAIRTMRRDRAARAEHDERDPKRALLDQRPGVPAAPSEDRRIRDVRPLLLEPEGEDGAREGAFDRWHAFLLEVGAPERRRPGARHGGRR